MDLGVTIHLLALGAPICSKVVVKRSILVTLPYRDQIHGVVTLSLVLPNIL